MKDKKRKIDERTRRALMTIDYGDVVKFYDCFEAEVYGDKTFRVVSEQPLISGGNVLVRLQGFEKQSGWFLIGNLKKVSTELLAFSDQEVIKGLICCDKTIPDCNNCPYNKLGATACDKQLLHDSNVLVRRRENAIKGVI